VSAAIQILPPESAIEQLQAPEGWAPQVFDVHEFVAGQHNSYEQTPNGNGNPYLAQMNDQRQP